MMDLVHFLAGAYLLYVGWNIEISNSDPLDKNVDFLFFRGTPIVLGLGILVGIFV